MIEIAYFISLYLYAFLNKTEYYMRKNSERVLIVSTGNWLDCKKCLLLYVVELDLNVSLQSP